MSTGDPLVTIVIPAFNAAGTLRETLLSAAAQTYRNLEILVVDDGSTDQTGRIVLEFGQTDSRVRLVQKTNGGVASARNKGIEESTGDYVAFLDADDLWHPTKIVKQMSVLLARSDQTALVYAPHRLIDENGLVIRSAVYFGIEGWVLFQHFNTNFVGNGSSILVKKTILQEIGGFDPSLRAEGAEGCEDLLLQLRLAGRCQFGTVREYLVGYRKRTANMSSDQDRMVRSGMLAVKMALCKYERLPELRADGLLNYLEWVRIANAFGHYHFIDFASLLIRQVKRTPRFVISSIHAELKAKRDELMAPLLQLIGLGSRQRHFYDYHPTEELRVSKMSDDLCRYRDLDRCPDMRLPVSS
jgi:glycosyltransferase involved in cell wall biosynthesis